MCRTLLYCHLAGKVRSIKKEEKEEKYINNVNI